jgi:hypothetical protein
MTSANDPRLRPNYMRTPDKAPQLPASATPVSPLRRTDDQWMALAAQNAPRVPWDVFAARWRWEPGEHVGLIGPTGQGKTTLLTEILKRRKYVAVFATKPRDPSLEAMLHSGQGYDLYQEWLDVDADKSPRRILWPDAREIDADERQAAVFDHAFKKIFREGEWCVANDEGWYIAELGLKKRMRSLWTQSRSLGISYVVGTQRPAWVPVEMYGESTHIFLWCMKEKDAVARVSNLGGADVDLARWIIRRLERFQCLYVNTRTGEMARTRAPRLDGVPAELPAHKPDWRR